MVYAIVLILIIALDQITKVIFAANGVGWGFDGIPGFIDFYCTKNSGAAWSFGANTSWAQTLFISLTCVILPALFVLFLGIRNDNKWLKTTVIFIIAGTIGNFIDRIVFGEVTDFLYLHWIKASCNVADVALTVGAVMLVIYFLFIDKDALIPIKKENG
ncbi:MAG: signal peptidase II [Clostridia bacterium]|nr:signal peptidase II [Clostridia bacterium]